MGRYAQMGYTAEVSETPLLEGAYAETMLPPLPPPL